MEPATSSEMLVRRIIIVDGQDVACRFFRPSPEGDDFICRLEIDWPEGTYSKRVYGIDEVQALLLAMQKAHTELLVAREQGGRQISWLGQRRLGLPVTDTLRDWDLEEAAAVAESGR